MKNGICSWLLTIGLILICQSFSMIRNLTRLDCALTIGLILICQSFALADPPLPKNAIYKPTFLVLNDSWTAGTAFVVRLEGETDLFLITANHLFGPDGGLQNQMKPDEIQAQVKGVASLSMQDTSKALWFPNFVKIADADSADSVTYSKDLAVFRAPNIPDLQVLELAKEAPKKGDRVWVFARQRGDDTPALLGATVDESNSNELSYIFDKPDFRLPGTSGAPVLNDQGKVVGMNLAGGENSKKQLEGVANPVISMRAELSAALIKN